MFNENETVERVCEKYRSIMPIPTDEILTAHKRELVAKDAEIVKFKENYEKLVVRKIIENCTAQNCSAWATIASLRTLVRELADVAERLVSCKATKCETVCGGGERCIHKKAIALVAKAREACK